MTTFVALGDSITVGMGDPAPGGGWRGWAALLAGTLPQPEMHNLATLGALAADVGTVHLDAAREPATYERRYWSVDRLHPNERGHRLIACRFHALLAASGYPVGPGPDPEPSSPPPTRLAEAGWMATKGTAWLVRRSRDLVPALVGLAVREWLAGDLDGADQDGSDQGRPEQDHQGQDGSGREPVNLNVLSRPSGNLRLNHRLPLTALKVRNRLSKRNDKDLAAPRHRVRGETHDPNLRPERCRTGAGLLGRTWFRRRS